MPDAVEPGASQPEPLEPGAFAPDAFEQDLLASIAEAEAFGEEELAAEWRLQLNTYRAAKRQAIDEGAAD